MPGFYFKVNLAKLLTLRNNRAELVNEVSRQGRLYDCLPEDECSVSKSGFGELGDYRWRFQGLFSEINEQYLALPESDQTSLRGLIFNDFLFTISDTVFVTEEGPLRFIAAFIGQLLGSDYKFDKEMFRGITDYSKLFFCALDDGREKMTLNAKVLENLDNWMTIFHISILRLNKFPESCDYFLKILSRLADMIDATLSDNPSFSHREDNLLPIIDLLTSTVDEIVDVLYGQIRTAAYIKEGNYTVVHLTDTPHLTDFKRLSELRCLSERLIDLYEKIKRLEGAEKYHDPDHARWVSDRLGKMITTLSGQEKTLDVISEYSCKGNGDSENMCHIMKDIKENNRRILNSAPELSSRIGRMAVVPRSPYPVSDSRYLAAEQHGRLPFSSGSNGRLSDASVVSEVASPSSLLVAGVSSLFVAAVGMTVYAGYTFFKNYREKNRRIGDIYYVKTPSEEPLKEVTSHSSANVSGR